MWNGWAAYGGTEIFNVARTEEYARGHGAYWLESLYGETDLADVLGQTYSTPLLDPAPWVDSRDPGSLEFFGAYPVDISGVDDSSLTATIVESVMDGGVVGASRRSTRTIVADCLLIGGSAAGCAAGMRWLTRVLTNSCAGDIRPCAGVTLCMLDAPPCSFGCSDGDDPVECFDYYQRQFFDAATTVGPQVTAKMPMQNGQEAWRVTFTIGVGNPFVYGSQLDLVAAFPPADNHTSPYIGGTPDGATWDMVGVNKSEVDCPVPTWQPLSDPSCPAIVPPPALPGVPLNCFDWPMNFRRWNFTIPQQFIPLWGEVMPRVVFHTADADFGPIRVRFLPLDNNGVVTTNECDFCGDFTVGYIPADSHLVVDGPTRTVYCQTPDGNIKSANGVLYGTDGAPFEWPILSCAPGFMVCIDAERSATLPMIDLSLTTRAA